jgi:hypothetical protein
MDAESEALVSEIRDAFQNVPRGILTMHQAHIVKWASEDKLIEAAALDRERSWTEINDETIVEARNALYGADPQSWRYFLPAYMVWTLKHLQSSSLSVIDQVVYTFQPYEVGHRLRQESVLRFDTLSLAQKRCVAHFLGYMAMHPESCDADAARRLLDTYWREFA